MPAHKLHIANEETYKHAAKSVRHNLNQLFYNDTPLRHQLKSNGSSSQAVTESDSLQLVNNNGAMKETIPIIQDKIPNSQEKEKQISTSLRWIQKTSRNRRKHLEHQVADSLASSSPCKRNQTWYRYQQNTKQAESNSTDSNNKNPSTTPHSHQQIKITTTIFSKLQIFRNKNNGELRAKL